SLPKASANHWAWSGVTGISSPGGWGGSNGVGSARRRVAPAGGRERAAVDEDRDHRVEVARRVAIVPGADAGLTVGAAGVPDALGEVDFEALTARGVRVVESDVAGVVVAERVVGGQHVE